MKTAIITGASGDIGFACCRKFLEEGYNVTACFNTDKESALKLLDFADSQKVLIIGADISKKEEAKRIFEETAKKFKGCDVLINNAGISLKGLIQDVSAKELDLIVDVNIKGTFNMCALAIKEMVKVQSGAIVNVASMWGETGASCEVAYSMTKSAIIGLTKALAKEVGPSKIRVNCVSPGLIDTKMNSCYCKEDIDSICNDTPLMQIGTTEDVANAVFFMSDDASHFITGQVLGVNGGYLI